MPQALKVSIVFLGVFVVVATGAVLTRREIRAAANEAADHAVDEAIQDLPETSVDVAAEILEGVGNVILGEGDETPASEPVGEESPAPDNTPSPAEASGEPEQKKRGGGLLDDPAGLFVRTVEKTLKISAELLRELEQAATPPSTPKERREFGEVVNRVIMDQARPSSNRELQDRIAALGKEVREQARKLYPEKDSTLPYTFTLIESDVPNAFAHDGGYVYVNTGLLELLKNEDQLTFVLAHEVGHVERCHTCTHTQVMKRTGEVAGEAGQVLGGLVYQTISLNYTSNKELEADAFGYQVARAMGVKTEDMLEVFTLLDSLAPPEPAEGSEEDLAAAVSEAVENHFRTHPPGRERKQAIRDLEKKDAETPRSGG